MTAVAWIIGGRRWLDESNPFISVVTLGGHHLLVLALAAGAFVMLSGLTIFTHGFVSANRWQRAAIVLACALSVIALAGALSAILLLLVVGLVLGLAVRPRR